MSGCRLPILSIQRILLIVFKTAERPTIKETIQPHGVPGRRRGNEQRVSYSVNFPEHVRQ